jgi:VCBS repeat protein
MIKAAHPAAAFGVLLAALSSSCARGTPSPDASTASSGATGGGGGESGVSGSSSASGSSGSAGGMSSGTGGALPVQCTLTPGSIDAIPFCHAPPPPTDGYTLHEKWHLTLPNQAFHEPVVANLTDDNGDGMINLCDTPDVVIIARDNDTDTGRIYLLSGSDGSVEKVIDSSNFWLGVTPAIGDIDGDGVPDLVVTDAEGHVIALRADGTVLWTSAETVWDPDPTLSNKLRGTAIALHDLDGDGHPEILAGLRVFNHDGTERFHVPGNGAELDGMSFAAIRPTAVDLDDDGKLEVLFGHATYSASGALLWSVPGAPAFAAPADFDGDGVPEVLLANQDGLRLVTAQGALLWGPLRPLDGPAIYGCWQHPMALGDLDGDGLPEAAINSCEQKAILRITLAGPTVLHATAFPFAGPQPAAVGSSMFDFRGLGGDWVAYHSSGNSRELAIYPGLKTQPLSVVQGMFFEFLFSPVVVDVDADGSADILVGRRGPTYDPDTLVAYEDELKRPSPARRIWNQYDYYVTSVNEDGTIPAHPIMPWKSGLHTYRSQARLSCTVPVPVP